MGTQAVTMASAQSQFPGSPACAVARRGPACGVCRIWCRRALRLGAASGPSRASSRNQDSNVAAISDTESGRALILKSLEGNARCRSFRVSQLVPGPGCELIPARDEPVAVRVRNYAWRSAREKAACGRNCPVRQ